MSYRVNSIEKILGKYQDMRNSNYFEQRELIIKLLCKEIKKLDRRAINFLDRRHTPYLLLYDNKRKFIYKKNLFERFLDYNKNFLYNWSKDDIPHNKCGIVLSDCLEKCNGIEFVKREYEDSLLTDFTPKIVHETENFYEVTYYNQKYRLMNIYDIHLLRKKENIDRLLSYTDSLNNNILCISDFNLRNLTIDTQTQKIYLQDIGDIEYRYFFNPNIFTYDTTPSSFTFFVKENNIKGAYSLTRLEYENIIHNSEYYKRSEPHTIEFI